VKSFHCTPKGLQRAAVASDLLRLHRSTDAPASGAPGTRKARKKRAKPRAEGQYPSSEIVDAWQIEQLWQDLEYRRNTHPTMSLSDVLDTCTDDVLLAIATALPSAADLLRLALTCRAAAQRFYLTATNYSAASSGTSGAGGATAAAHRIDTWCIAEEAARRWIAACSDQERGWVPRRGRESWLGLMWEVQSLRRGAAVFGRSHVTITLSEGGSRATKMVGGTESRYRRTAASKTVMRAGRHYAQFTVACSRRSMPINFGAIRPGYDVETGAANRVHTHGHCLYEVFWDLGYTGYHWPAGQDWEEREGVRVKGDRIGMLLDLDQGSMTVYKNDERLAVMATGLSGEYCWAVTLLARGHSVRIEAAPPPVSPTAQELAQAVAYEAAYEAERAAV
jgi:hypothetical protein